jgi:hypothetical protein
MDVAQARQVIELRKQGVRFDVNPETLNLMGFNPASEAQ